MGALIFLDSNILIDLLDDDPEWFAWSSSEVEKAGAVAQLIINPIVVAETASAFDSLKAFESAMKAIKVNFAPLSNEIAFLAGKTFRDYRAKRKQGAAKSVLPDFLIGAHAQALDASILTRDSKFYRAYFPQVPLITPMRETP